MLNNHFINKYREKLNSWLGMYNRLSARLSTFSTGASYPHWFLLCSELVVPVLRDVPHPGQRLVARLLYDLQVAHLQQGVISVRRFSTRTVNRASQNFTVTVPGESFRNVFLPCSHACLAKCLWKIEEEVGQQTQPVRLVSWLVDKWWLCQL